MKNEMSTTYIQKYLSNNAKAYINGYQVVAELPIEKVVLAYLFLKQRDLDLKSFDFIDVENLNLIEELDKNNIKLLEENKKLFEIDGFKVKILGGSLRLETFYQDFLKNSKTKNSKSFVECACCGKKATKIALVKQQVNKNKGNSFSADGTLELFADDGDRILFTHDHVHNRANGGKDDLENTVAMCFECNSVKSFLFENPKHPLFIDFNYSLDKLKKFKNSEN